MDYLNKNIELLRAEIEEACSKVGRKSSEIKLIAVSKTIPSEIINEAVKFGITDFGENRVQELVNKMDLVDQKACFHLIGHLQTNKVKYVVGKVKSIQSVDSLKVLNEINKKSVERNLITNCLIQIHTAKEETKFGLNENELENFLANVGEFKNVRLNGLMTIGTFTDDEKEIRRCFVLLRNLRDKYQNHKTDNIDLKELSMGMTSDYKIAIEEGATILRIGTAIFGKRNYNN
ncbi:MAG: YggS family pyridoxal phosphate-dependent enzyme [Ignavibacteria bacterium]|nr:YggS family pyridoxal phosphate-dependent enzyme [Ignavibacteria bacterium]